MEKLTDKIAAIPENGTYFSLEFFPPKTSMVLSFSVRRNALPNSVYRGFRTFKVVWSACLVFFNRFL